MEQVPLSAFYDLSSWSAPIMENLNGAGWSSVQLAKRHLEAARRLGDLTQFAAELRSQVRTAHRLWSVDCPELYTCLRCAHVHGV